MKTILTTIVTLVAGSALAIVVDCGNWADLKYALEEGKDVNLTGDIEQGNGSQICPSGTVTLNLNGHKLKVDTNRVFSVTVEGCNLTIDDTIGGGVIDGQGVVRKNVANGGFLWLNNASASVTLKGGTIANFAVPNVGGAIGVEAGTLNIVGGVITNCSAVGGGGVNGNVSSTIKVSGGKIVGCCAKIGGGIRMYGGSLTLTGGEIAYNKSIGQGNGINCDDHGSGTSTFTMSGGKIHHNTDAEDPRTDQGGGGILLWSAVKATITGGEISDNVTGSGGGGVILSGATLTLSGGTIRGNKARLGGAFYNAGTLTVNDGTISGNTALHGGALYNCGTASVYGGTVNDNAANASASDSFGGFCYNYNKCRVSIYGGHFFGNKAPAGHCDFLHCYEWQQNGALYGGVFAADPIADSTGSKCCLAPQNGVTVNMVGSLYVVAKNVMLADGKLAGGSYSFNPTDRLYKDLGISLAEGCHVTRSGAGYAIVAVRGTVLSGFVNEAIAFHGFLAKADGTKFLPNQVVKVDFKLYPTSSSAELLWARRIPVTIDKNSGYYVDISDASGQVYQSPDGAKPVCTSLRTALARHAQTSPGPLWLAYEPVEATVKTPFPRVPLFFQPIAQRASSAAHATVASVASVETASLNAADESTVTADRLVINTGLVRMNGLKFDVPHRDVPLNESGAVKIRSMTGLTCSAATNTLGALVADLPSPADSDCGRVVKHVVNGVETLSALYYSKGDTTTLPEGSTNVYVWSFGPIVETTAK